MDGLNDRRSLNLTALNFDSHKQLYYQLYDRLFQGIINGQYGLGELIPSESNLMKEYGVSRATARKAMEMLANDGFVKKRRGVGTVVISTRPKHSPQRVVNYSRKSIKEKTEKRIVDFKTLPAPSDIATLLDLEKETDLIRLRRVRYGDGSPSYLEINYFEKEYVPNLLNKDFSKESLRVFLDKNYNIQWAYAKQEIYAEVADKEISLLLEVDIGHPLLRIKRVSFDINDTPREFVDTYYLGNKYNLEIELRI